MNRLIWTFFAVAMGAAACSPAPTAAPGSTVADTAAAPDTTHLDATDVAQPTGDADAAAGGNADASSQDSDDAAMQDGGSGAVDTAVDADTGDSGAAGDAGADVAGDADGDGSADVAAGVVVGPGEPGGKVVAGPAGSCVEPDKTVPGACQFVSCAAGNVCVGKGECVPKAAFWADSVAPANQAWSAVATRPDGAYAAVWSAGKFFEGDMHIWMRVFAAGDDKGGAPLQVSEVGTPPNLAPSVAAMADGSWMVLWRRDDAANEVVSYQARKVQADGKVLAGPSQQVNTTVLGSSASSGSTNIIAPIVAKLRNGRLLMAWSGGAKGGATPLGVYARLFDDTGAALTGELDTGAIPVNGQSFSPAIGALSGGKAILTWEGPAVGGKGPRRVLGRVLGEVGAPQSPVLTLSPAAQPYEALPAVAAYASAQTLLTWKSGLDPLATSAVTVRSRLLGEALPQAPGQPVPAGAAADLDADGEGTYPGAAAIAVLSEQRAMAVWHNMGQLDHNIWGKRHYRSADAWDCQVSDVGGPKLTDEVGPRYLPALATWETGKFVLAFSTQLAGFDQYRVALRLGHW